MKPVSTVVCFVTTLLLIATSGCGQSIDQRLSKIAQALELSNSELASFEAKAVLQEAPENGKARLLLAKALIQLGDLPGAEVELQRAMASEGAGEEVHIAHADIWLLQNRPGQVIAAHENLISQNRRLGPAYLLRVINAHLSLGQLSDARQQLSEALRSSPSDLALRVLAIRMEAAEGRTASAIKLSDALLSAEPNSPQVRLLRADLQRMTGASCGGGKSLVSTGPRRPA